MKVLFFILCFSFLFTSCKSMYKAAYKHPVHMISKKEESSTIIKRVLHKPYVSSFGSIKMDQNKKVDKWINYFQTRGKERMQVYLSRSTRYLSMMKSVMREYHLPEDLVYVSMIESGFSAKAHSFANAVGYWQFITGTGKRYGLKINSHTDERRDPVLSTRAAAEYFKDLYGIYASWHLALASYNAGEYRVNRFVMRYYSRDFWYLSAKKSFPRETANYIPKLIAAIHISKNPKKYGFINIKYQDPLEYDTVQLKFSINLKKLAHKLNIPYKQIQMLNPRYRGVYAHSAGDTVIRIPVGKKEFVSSTLEQYRMKQPRYVYSDYYWYRIRRGDTLYQLARRHKTSVKTIRRINKMRSRSFLRSGRKIKLPYRNRVARKHKKRRKYTLPKSYVVKSGDSLYSISKKYKIRTSRLKKINKLFTRSVIHPGQVLKLVPSYKKKIRYKKVSRSVSSTKLHTVKKGETLISIAKTYKISLPALMKKNSFNFNSIIQIGKKIIIP